MLLDATEIFAEVASMKSVNINAILYSAYKHHSTLKWLVGCDPIWTVWDDSVSDGYPGAVSDPTQTMYHHPCTGPSDTCLSHLEDSAQDSHLWQKTFLRVRPEKSVPGTYAQNTNKMSIFINLAIIVDKNSYKRISISSQTLYIYILLSKKL